MAVLTIVFIVFSVLPSDPIRNALGVNASEQAVQAVRHELGYDRPLLDRYFDFITGALRLDFGQSVHSGRDVGSLVFSAATLTVLNSGFALIAGAILSLWLVAMGQAFTKTEPVILLICRAFTSIPSVIVALAAGTSVYLLAAGLLGSGMRTTVGIVSALLVYPMFSLAEVGIMQARQIRTSTFVTASRSFGMGNASVFVHCILPGILTSWLGQLSNLAATVFVSSAVFEVVFSFPGLGYVLSRAVIENDLPIIQGVVIVVVLGFLLLDAIFELVWLPRSALYKKRFAA